MKPFDKQAMWVASVCLTAFLLSCSSPPEAADLLITHARIIDGNGTVLDDATIAITGERIQTITSAETPFTAGTTIDAEGKTVLPGLINTHVHIGSQGRFVDEQTLAEYLSSGLSRDMQDYLDHGITSIKSTGDLTEPFLAVREGLAHGEIQGPRLFLVGPVLSAPEGHPSVTVYPDNPWLREGAARELSTEEEARAVVRQLSESGVDAIKFVYHGSSDENQPYFLRPGLAIRKITPQVMKAIIEEGHKHQLPVTAHTADLEDAVAVVEAGVDGLEHGVTRERIVDEQLGTLLLQQDTFYGPTLSGYLNGNPQMADTLLPNLKGLADQGVRMVLGTDGGPARGGDGVGTLKEMEWMVQAGMSPAQVIQAGTRHGAELLGKLDELGTLEAGKLADLIMVDGDPLKDISEIHNIDVVIKGGKIVVDHR
jgi:enamidase